VSRWIYVEIRSRNKSPEELSKKERERISDRIRRFFNTKAKENPYLEELRDCIDSGRKRLRETGKFKAYMSVEANQSPRMGLLVLLGYPEEAIREEARERYSVLATLATVFSEVAKKTKTEFAIRVPEGIITSPEDARGMLAEVEYIMDKIAQIKREAKTIEYRRSLNEALKTAAAHLFGDVYTTALYDFLKELTARYHDLEALYEDEGFIPALGVRVKFVEGKEVPDLESAAEFVCDYLTKAAKASEKARSYFLDTLDATKDFWALKYGEEFAEKAYELGEKMFKENRKFLVECPEELKSYVRHLEIDRASGVILAPGNIVVYSCTRTSVSPKIIFEAVPDRDPIARRYEAPKTVPVSELPNYGKFYDPPNLDEVYEKFKKYAHCPLAKPYLDTLKWAIETREMQKSLLGVQEKKRGLEDLRRFLMDA